MAWHLKSRRDGKILLENVVIYCVAAVLLPKNVYVHLVGVNNSEMA